MHGRFIVTFLLLLSLATLPAQVRLLIGGNTADATPDYYTTLNQAINQPGTPATVLFAGDYIDDCTEAMLGFKAKSTNGDEVFPTLQPLIQLVKDNPNTTFYFLPGDRDWDGSGPDGLKCVRAVEDYLRSQQLSNLFWPLTEGCPGPETINLSTTVKLIMVNTQWWNHPYKKPVPADKDCDFSDPTISVADILSQIEEHQDQNIIIAGHYPPKSQGRRGGSFPVRDYFAPPIYGSFRVSFRQNIGTPEELTNRRFEVFAKKMRDFNSQFEGLLFVGAQDRSQQLLSFGRNFIVNAGAAGEGRWVAKHKPAMHTSRVAGVTELNYELDGSVRYNYYHVNESTTRPSHSEMLYRTPCSIVGNADTIDANPAFPPCELAAADIESFYKSLGDTLVAAPGPQYARSGFGELFLGKHYRDVWTTPVNYPVLDLDAYPLDLRPIRQGGGRQTTSLKLRAADGRSFVFRSVDKDPSGTFNYQIRNTLVGDAIRDQTSSGHPYGNLIIAPLLDTLGILHASPEPYVLAPAKALGDFNPKFGGLLGSLEISPQGEDEKKGRPGTFGADRILKSFELFRARYDDQEVVINETEFLRARLFDILVGDWSRHEDNWKWARYGTKGDVDEVGRIRPIPRDRDNAFSKLHGLFPWAASRRWAIPNLENFGWQKPDMQSLTYQARYMDRLLLSRLTREEFRRQALTLQQAMTDTVLLAALAQIPAPATSQNDKVSGAAGAEQVDAYHAEHAVIFDKLQRRRNDLLEYADDYYELHAETVDIVGTNDEEAFLIEAYEDGRLRVTITDVKGKSEGKTLYDRTFLPSETNEVRIYGLGDDDQFNTIGPVGKRIRVHIVGGNGDDEYASDGKNRARVYDKSIEGDPASSGLKFIRSWRDYLYYYDRTAFNYNKTAPVISVGYNSYSGAQFRAGVSHTRTNFTRRNLSKRYTFFVEGGSLGNVAAEARAEFGQVIRYADLVVSTRVGEPDFYNFFFGLGNNSELVPDTDRNTFNLVSLDHFDVQLGLRRRYAERSSFNLWFGYQDNKTTDQEGTILDLPEMDFYGEGGLSFGFIKPEFVLDLRDHPTFPSKGVLFEASHKQGYGRKQAVDFNVTKVAAEFHVSTRRFPIGVSFRTGYARSGGEAPFYELPTLGRNNGLRGFQRNRFTGDGYFFYNTEFRMPLALVRSRVIPFAVGIRAFYDRGRIIQDDDGDDSMKSAYGGGLFIIPASKSFTLSALLGWSEEESALVQVGVGTGF